MRSETTKAGASPYPKQTEREQPRDVSGTERRSTGRQEERTKWSGDEHAGVSSLPHRSGPSPQKPFGKNGEITRTGYRIRGRVAEMMCMQLPGCMS